MQREFSVFRAIGMAFSCWFHNFVPFTVLAIALYAPVVIWVATMDLSKVSSFDELLNQVFLWPVYLVTGIATLLAPMLTYRVVQHLNGARVSMFASIRYGVRGFIPAVVLAVVVNLLQQIPIGGFLGAIVTCHWFVAAPAAVAEKLGPSAAFVRGSELTRGRRWGIFGLTFLLGLSMIALLTVWIGPMMSSSTAEPLDIAKQTAFFFVGVLGVFHLFNGIVQATAYTLLREDKEGVSLDALAAVFD